MNSINITIIGASITGLSTAIALKQKGFKVTIMNVMSQNRL